jgi:hypothetical protein
MEQAQPALLKLAARVSSLPLFSTIFSFLPLRFTFELSILFSLLNFVF